MGNSEGPHFSVVEEKLLLKCIKLERIARLAKYCLNQYRKSLLPVHLESQLSSMFNESFLRRCIGKIVALIILGLNFEVTVCVKFVVLRNCTSTICCCNCNNSIAIQYLSALPTLHAHCPNNTAIIMLCNQLRITWSSHSSYDILLQLLCTCKNNEYILAETPSRGWSAYSRYNPINRKLVEVKLPCSSKVGWRRVLMAYPNRKVFGSPDGKQRPVN